MDDTVGWTNIYFDGYHATGFQTTGISSSDSIGGGNCGSGSCDPGTYCLTSSVDVFETAMANMSMEVLGSWEYGICSNNPNRQCRSDDGYHGWSGCLTCGDGSGRACVSATDGINNNPNSTCGGNAACNNQATDGVCSVYGKNQGGYYIRKVIDARSVCLSQPASLLLMLRHTLMLLTPIFGMMTFTLT